MKVKKITVEKYAMKKAIERMFEAQKMMSETEKLNVEFSSHFREFENDFSRKYPYEMVSSHL